MTNEQIQALKAAAEKATPGRIGDRIDGSGSIKYECVGYDGSLVLKTDHKNMEYGFVGDNADADELFFRLCVPDFILSLLAERDADKALIAEQEKRIAELEARALLAACEQEPALHRYRRVSVEPFGPYPWHYGDFVGFSEPVDGIEDEYFYSRPAPSISTVPECFQRLLHHAEGMSMGIDWNNGTAAGHHREKMLEAVQDCRAAMLNGGKS